MRLIRFSLKAFRSGVHLPNERKNGIPSGREREDVHRATSESENAVVTYEEKSQRGDTSARNDFLAGMEIQAMAEVAGFRVLRIQLSKGQHIDWFTAEHAHTTFFACEDGLTIQLKNPPIRWPLRAGEIYTVPPRMELTVFSESGAALSFAMLQYGGSLNTVRTSAPERNFSFGRSIPPSSDIGPRPPASEDELHLYHHGLKRMDILALQPDLRAVVQAHGPFECVPWHTHDNIADTFFAMEGYVQIAIKDPDDAVVLAPGEIYSVPAGQPHFVSGADGKECTVMVVQGVGIYNYKAYLEDMRGAVEDMILK